MKKFIILVYVIFAAFILFVSYTSSYFSDFEAGSGSTIQAGTWEELKVVINEIMYNPTQNDFYNEWIELYNPTSQPINLSDWTIGGDELIEGYINHSDGHVYGVSGMVIPANGYAVVTDGGSGTEVYSNFTVHPSAVAFHVNSSSLTVGGLSNTGDTIVLKNSTGVEIDSVTYSYLWGADGNGKSLERKDPFDDSNDSGNWEESAAIGGTPGSLN